MPPAARIVSLVVPVALFACGCSEAVPPLSSGAFQLTFQSLSHEPGVPCGVATHNVQVGAVDAANLTSLIKDTVDGTTVLCSVEGTGSFAVHAQIEHAPNYLQIEIPAISVDNKDTSPAAGSLALASATTVTSFTSPETQPCNFYLSGSKEQVIPGAAWLSFDCPVVKNASAGKSCAVETGVIAVESCDK